MNEQYTNIMIDLETWGTIPGCAIRSIGAVTFGQNAIIAPFYVNVDLDSQRRCGLHQDPETMSWWRSQTAEAQNAFSEQPHIHIVAALDRLWSYVERRDPKNVRVWCHGLSFDLPILKAAAHACGMPKEPWEFRNERDTRTIYGMLTPEQYESLPKYEGTKHHALKDAENQARQVMAAIHMIRMNIAMRAVGVASNDGAGE